MELARLPVTYGQYSDFGYYLLWPHLSPDWHIPVFLGNFSVRMDFHGERVPFQPISFTQLQLHLEKRSAEPPLGMKEQKSNYVVVPQNRWIFQVLNHSRPSLFLTSDKMMILKNNI